jgi:DNA replication protein DnaC
MNEDLTKMLKTIRLGGLLANWDQTLAAARKGRFSHTRLLTYVIEQEFKIKTENARQCRLRRAHIPEMLLMETYPFRRQPKLNRKNILSIYDAFDYVDQAQNIIWMGPTGCGKTGLATAFLIDAINRGHSGRFVSFAQLIEDLRLAGADYSQSKVLKRYQACDCLLIDELGYVEVEPAQVGLFFTLMQRRHKKKPTLITTNLGFSEWRSFLKNDHLAAALIDRLTENSHVINMKQCRTLRDPIRPQP